MKSCTVYCSSSAHLEPSFHDAAAALGAELGRRGLDVVYGGGSKGLMGTVARAAKDHGSRVTGIITERLHAPERAWDGVDEMIVVPTMRERKRLLLTQGEGIIMLPGGVGTLEEFFEALAGRIVGEHVLPIGILEVEDFFAPLHELLRHGIEHRFIKPAVMELVQIDRSPAALVDAMLAHDGAPIDEQRFFPTGQG